MKTSAQDIENKPTFWMKAHSSEGSLPELVVKSAIVEEALSELTRMRIEFLCRDRSLSLRGLLGQYITLCYAEQDRDPRYFHGYCVEAECIGQYQGMARFIAEVRPAAWFLTRRRDCRIFQGSKASEIVHKVMNGNGVATELKSNLSGGHEIREFCVQYRETDFAFISRLMEEDGIYYYFTYDEHGAAMVLADGPGQHKPIPGGKLEFVETEVVEFDHGDQVFEWTAQDRATSGKVSLVSYNFETPNRGLHVSSSLSHGKHAMAQAEQYDNQGRYTEAEQGQPWAKARMEAEHRSAQVWTGLSNAYRLSPGHTFALTRGPRSGEPTEFLITRATHYIQRDEDARQTVIGVHAVERALDLGRHTDKPYRCRFEAIPQSVQFRPPQVTPWPNVGGVHTAVVTGPPGEEIHTDKYGRVKIQFHWDREGKNDDKSSIWVRTMMPWTGKTWGAIAVPRVGNEVVVQFEEGDPDRPIVIGMVYNGANMPPFALPENKTVSGVKTNSSKGGDGYNELIFEDKKGDELVRFHAEKDYLQVVENNAKISIGKEKKDAGDLTQWIHRNRTTVTGLIDADATAGVKATAVGGAISEVVLGVKTTSVGYHVYEKIGISLGSIPGIAGVVGKQVSMKGADTPSDVAKAGESEFFDGIDEQFGSTGVVKAIWSGFSGYGAFAGPAAAAVIGGFKAKGLKPGRTTEILGNSKLTIKKSGMAEGHSDITLEDGTQTTIIDKGDLLETVKKGKHELKVETGDHIVKVDKGKREITVGQGDLITTLNMGNQKTTLKQGNQTTEVKMGNVSVKADLGSITLEAMQKITLKVGGNKIEISQMGIKIEGMLVDVKGQVKTEVQGGAMTIVKGGFVMIN